MNRNLIIIGGVAAGMSAAAKARRINPEADIKVFTDDRDISYSSCSLPYHIGDVITSHQALIARTVEQFSSQGTKVFTRTRAVEIHPDNKEIFLKDLTSDRCFKDNYDKLIIATGARPIRPTLEGVFLNGIFTLRNIEDSVAIKSYLQDNKPQNAVIIGGGYIGLEMIENLLVYGCTITVVEKAPLILSNMDSDIAAKIVNYLNEKGINLRMGEAVTAFKGDGKVNEVITDRASFPADLVILSIGVTPNTEIAAKANINLGISQAIRVNEKMETSIPDIYAAGDCATTTHLISGQEVYIPMGTTANKQGKIAGENAAGGQASFKGVLGTGITKIMDIEVSRTGLSEQECQHLGIEYTSNTIKSRTKVPIYPDAGLIYVKLIAEKNSRRLLGGQIAGYAGSAKRIDTIAAALTMNARVDDLIDMDLAYAPPFSPTWDPVLTALNKF